MTAYFLILWFTAAPFQMVPMPDMATCEGAKRVARWASNEQGTVNKAQCVEIANGQPTGWKPITDGSPTTR